MDTRRPNTPAKIAKGRYEFDGFVVYKNHYDWLWYIKYPDSFSNWGGPFRTRQEALEKIKDHRMP